MKHYVTLRHTAAISFPFVLLICALGSACGSPTSPTSRTPSAGPVAPPPAPTLVRYHVTGVVTDENGAPLAGVPVTVDYVPGGNFASPPGRCVMDMLCLISTSTNDRGEYEVSFEPGLGSIFQGEGAGLTYSLPAGFEHNIQPVPRGDPEVRQTLRLRRVRTVSVGQPITVSIERDSTLCSDLEDWWSLANRCEILSVLVGETGTLTVDARAVQTGSDHALVFFATTGRYTTTQRNEPGRATVGVEAGQRYRVFIGTRNGNAPARYDVLTSLR